MPLHARLEGRLVPTSSCPPPFSSSADAPAAPAAARLDRAHVAVIDNFVSERARAELLSLVVFGRREEEEKGSSRRYDELSGSEGLPRPRWERRTADSAEDAAAFEGEEEEEEEGGGGGGVGSGRRLGWGLSSPAIDDLLRRASPSLSLSAPPPPRALAEVGSKLSAMFPEHDCLWLPTESMEDGRKGRERERRKKQGGEREQEDDEKNGGDDSGDGAFGGGDDGGDGAFGGGDDKPFSSSSTSPPLLANAASSSDAFSYHVDCDPDSSSHPGTPWHEAYGHYVNGEPNKPLLASLVLYLNESWQPTFAGETLVMDSTAGVGCAVLPRPRRALLLESDVLHKVCPPSSGDCASAAGNRLRFSLVFKLALCPKRTSFSSLSSSSNNSNNVNVLSREWWGPPADLGSAKALSELVRRVGEEKKRKRSGGG